MKSVLLEKSLRLSIEMLKWSSQISFGDSYFIKSQIQRSCTSIGAHIREAQCSKSSKDFINKLKSAFQELEETEYWLKVISDGLGKQPSDELENLRIECRKMLCASLGTASRNLKRSNLKKPPSNSSTKPHP